MLIDDKILRATVIFLILLTILALNGGCATDNKPKCTWICPTANIPSDCYCLEEEIGREADSLNKKKR